MFQILLIIHLILCIVLVGAILLQRSEGGGALGIGGGPSSMMSGRSATNFMTKVTQALGLAFFMTSIGLSLVAGNTQRPATSIMQDGSTDPDGIPLEGIDLSVPDTDPAAAPASGGGLLDLPASQAVPTAPPAETSPEAAPPATAPPASEQ